MQRWTLTNAKRIIESILGLLHAIRLLRLTAAIARASVSTLKLLQKVFNTYVRWYIWSITTEYVNQFVFAVTVLNDIWIVLIRFLWFLLMRRQPMEIIAIEIVIGVLMLGERWIKEAGP